MQKFGQTGVDFKELLKDSDQELERVLGLIKPVVVDDSDPRKVHFNNLSGYFSKELNRTGVTLLLLWEEYIKEYPSGFQYSRFCELIACPVNVAILPFSGYGYVEALPDAKLPQVVKALNHTIEYFGGVPLTVKSDNMRQWVSRSCKYEPVFTDMFEQWANHNNIALLAARPYKQKDKPSK